jgi:hypothetical protein
VSPNDRGDRYLVGADMGSNDGRETTRRRVQSHVTRLQLLRPSIVQ